MDRSDEYKGFRYWLVETKRRCVQVWRIQLPSGENLPPKEFARESDVRGEIDQLAAAVITAA